MRERLPVLHRYEEEKEEGEGREVKEKGCFGGTKKPDLGGTSERERETILSTKAAFPTSKGGFFFFVIPLVISADIRAQKMWVSGVSEER